MSYKTPPYPAILTDSDWQNNKGKIAKVAGETGIGTLMDKAAVAYKGVAWDDLDVRKNCKGHVKDWTEGDVDKAFDKAKAQWPKLSALENALKAIEKEGASVAAAWKRTS